MTRPHSTRACQAGGFASFTLLLAVLSAGCSGRDGRPESAAHKPKLVPVLALSVSPDGRLIACCNRDNTVTLRDGATLKTVRTFRYGDRLPVAVRFSPRGETLLVGYYDGMAAIWDVQPAANEPLILGHHDADIRSAVFSHDGRMAATADGNGDIILWNVNVRSGGYQVLRQRTPIWSLAFLRDDKRLAAGTSSGHISLWDVDTGRAVATLTGHSGAVRSLSVSPDGKRLISASLDSTVRGWDLEAGRELWQFTAEGNGVTSAALSHDGGTIAVGTTFSGDVQIWNARTRKLSSTIPAHNTMANDLAFARDGTLISCGMDGEVQSWLVAKPARRDSAARPAIASLVRPRFRAVH